MKKLTSIALAGLASIALSSCGGGNDSSNEIDYEYFFLVDFNIKGVENVPYRCTSGTRGLTDDKGAFKFDIDGDNCRFDLDGLDPQFDQLYIDDDYEQGVGNGIPNIPYECDSNIFGKTTFEGEFDFAKDDICHFEL